MSVPTAFARVAAAFSRAGLAPYYDSIARWPGVPVLDDGGSIVEPGSPVGLSCMCQVDAVTEGMRAEAGFAEKDVALLVLVATLEVPLDTDATVEVTAGPGAGSYSVQSVGLDAMGSHYVCRGRPA